MHINLYAHLWYVYICAWYTYINIVINIRAYIKTHTFMYVTARAVE